MQYVTSIIALVTFIGTISIFLFKKVVIEPLQKSIDSLNNTLKEFKNNTEKHMDMIEQRVDLLEDRTSRHDEKFISLFKQIGGNEK